MKKSDFKTNNFYVLTQIKILFDLNIKVRIYTEIYNATLDKIKIILHSQNWRTHIIIKKLDDETYGGGNRKNQYKKTSITESCYIFMEII